MFDEFVKKIISELEARESRGRARSGDPQDKFGDRLECEPCVFPTAMALSGIANRQNS